MNPTNYLYLSAILFSIGAVGVIVRKNAIVVFMWVMLAPGFAVSAYATLEPTTRLITVAILRIVLRI